MESNPTALLFGTAHGRIYVCKINQTRATMGMALIFFFSFE